MLSTTINRAADNGVDIRDWPVRRGEYFLRRMKSPRAPRRCVVMGVEFEIQPDVFSPALSKATEFLARHLMDRIRGKVVFEVGCGSGAVSILCALHGASRVVCSDVTDAAVACTKANISRHGVEDKVSVIQAPDFDQTQGRFDVVFFALPYVYVHDITPMLRRYGSLAYAVFDEGYAAQRAFIMRAPGFLAPGGEILVEFSVIGDQGRFQSNIQDAGLAAHIIAREREGRADNRLYRLDRSSKCADTRKS